MSFLHPIFERIFSTRHSHYDPYYLNNVFIIFSGSFHQVPLTHLHTPCAHRLQSPQILTFVPTVYHFSFSLHLHFMLYNNIGRERRKEIMHSFFRIPTQAKCCLNQ